MSSKNEKIEDITEIKKLQTALDLMQSAKSNMNDMFEGLEKIISNTKKTLLGLEEEKNKLEKIKEQQEREISGLTNDQMKLLKEYEQVKGELEKFTQSAAGDVNIETMTATLAIYRILLEQIWQSQPHFKVLYLLHGDKDTLDVESLKMASGISGAMILRACHELSNVNLITFDIETKKAKLTKRLFPQKKSNPIK